MSIYFKDFLENDKTQEILNKMDDSKCYTVQYKSVGDKEFTEISTSPRDIYTFEEADKRFRADMGAKGTQIRLVKISKYLTSHGKLVPVSVVKFRIVAQ